MKSFSCSTPCHPHRCAVVSCFNLHFPNHIWLCSPFHVLIYFLFIFCEVPVQVFFACLLNWFILSDKFVHFVHKSFIIHVIFTYFLPAWHVFLLPWKCLLQFKCFKYSLSNFLSYSMLQCHVWKLIIFFLRFLLRILKACFIVGVNMFLILLLAFQIYDHLTIRLITSVIFL